MKIRADFVTNSSSSSYTVEIRMYKKDGREGASFCEDPRFYFDDFSEVCADAYFSADLQLVFNELMNGSREKFASVRDLVQYLMDCEGTSVIDPLDEDDADLRKEAEENKARFVREACDAFPSLDDTKSIVVERDYDTRGEFTPCDEGILEEDEELCRLARKVATSRGDEQKRAIRELEEYARTPSIKSPDGTEFADGYGITYKWRGGEEELIRAAKGLWQRADRGIMPGRSGHERHELDFEAGKMSNQADIELS